VPPPLAARTAAWLQGTKYEGVRMLRLSNDIYMKIRSQRRTNQGGHRLGEL